MKLILASSGFTTSESAKKCVEFVGKPANEISFAVIKEAMNVEFGDHKWFLEDMDGIRQNFGGNIEFVNLLALDQDKTMERIMANDVVFVAGGNTDYLMTVFEKTGFTEILPAILAKKVYVGSSAGSCVLGHRPSYKTFDENYHEAQYTDKYLELADFTILPHLNSPYFNTRGEEWVLDDSKKEDCPVYAISDDAVVVVDGDKNEVLGKDWIAAENGGIRGRG